MFECEDPTFRLSSTISGGTRRRSSASSSDAVEGGWSRSRERGEAAKPSFWSEHVGEGAIDDAVGLLLQRVGEFNLKRPNKGATMSS